MELNPNVMNAINARLANLAAMPPITVEAIDDETGEAKLWFRGGPGDVARLRLAGSDDRHTLTALVGAELMRWHRAAAATKRVWQVRDRQLREWKAAQTIIATTPPHEAETDLETTEPTAKKPKAKEWKAPTIPQVEAFYRAQPTYGRLNALVERAEEAHSSASGVVDVYQTIARLLAVIDENAYGRN